VADPEVDPPVRSLRTWAVVGLLLGLALLGTVAAAPAGAAAPVAPAARAGVSPAATPTPVTGNVSGPAYLATSTNGTFRFNATGGPGVVGGTVLGKLTWVATLGGPNTTGTSVTPSNGSITSLASEPVSLSVKVGIHTGQFTLSVTVTSTLAKNNSSATISKAFHVLVPYVLRATLVAGPAAEVMPFQVQVALDGSIVGSATVPKLAPNATYHFSFRYADPNLGSGYHTFTLTIANAHGLVTFSNGRTVQSTTFYVAPGATNYTIYYVLGAVVFLGVLFIYATRVGARRRGTARR
jgi:hypothetical protein